MNTCEAPPRAAAALGPAAEMEGTKRLHDFPTASCNSLGLLESSELESSLRLCLPMLPCSQCIVTTPEMLIGGLRRLVLGHELLLRMPRSHLAGGERAGLCTGRFELLLKPLAAQVLDSRRQPTPHITSPAAARRHAVQLRGGGVQLGGGAVR